MKSPDEIKKGLECCSTSACKCFDCPYEGECHLPFGSDPESDALALIQQLEAERDAPEDNKFQYETGFIKGFEAAYPKWISVKERLPKADEVCIAVNRDGDIMIGHIHKVINGSCMCDDINSSEWIIKVTHWMPLPKPPKEDT